MPNTSIRIAVLLGTAALTLFSIQAQSPNESPSDEYLLLGSPNRGAGEPWVFVNPKDPKNIIVVAMATLNRLPSGEYPIPSGPFGTPDPRAKERTELRIKELSTPDGSRTDIAVTEDGGQTWKFSEDDLRRYFKKNRCSDSFAGAGPDGVLYMGCLAYLNPGAADYADGYSPGGEAKTYHGGSAIEWSGDKGRTWNPPIWVHPALTPSVYPPNVKPVFQGASPWDRPVFIADASTGTIYVAGSGLTQSAETATARGPKDNSDSADKDFRGMPAGLRFRTFLRASHDGGRTWGLIYPIDNDDYSGGFFANIGGFSSAFGHLVVAFNTEKVPASDHADCPCTLLGISEDDGKTYSYKVIPPLPKDTSSAMSQAARRADTPMALSLPFIISVSADPKQEGRYAVARLAGSRIMISVTEDGGKTWLPPVAAAEVPPNARFAHHAMKYSAKGDLGLMWKAAYPDNTFDVWSAVSQDGGRSFKTVRVSHAISPPYNPERGNFMFGDDLSSMDIDGEFLYAVWGDNRAGFEGTWFGRIPLSAY